MWEADFAICCSQCGGQEFQEVFPVPAEVYRAYNPTGERGKPRELIASVYVCLQCGHLERFVELTGQERPPPPPNREMGAWEIGGAPTTRPSRGRGEREMR